MLLGFIWLFTNVLGIVAFLLKAWWLYMINTKLWEKYAWISWIPVLNIYALLKAWGKNPIWILWLVLSYILLIIPFIILIISMSNWTSDSMFWIVLWFIIFAIPLITLTIKIYSWISKRTWRWVWTTILLLLFPAIMLPVVGYKLKSSGVIDNQTEKIEDNIKL